MTRLGRMRAGAVAGAAAGAALGAWLLSRYGLATVLRLIAHAGWGLVPAIAFHATQILCSALAWQAVMPPAAPNPADAPHPSRNSFGLPLRDYILLRWVREGVNNLLPVAQVGGQVVNVHMLRSRGVPLAAATAGTVADLTMEVLTQLGFVLLGLALLTVLGGAGAIVRAVAGGVLLALCAVGGLLAVQTLGGGRLIERVAAGLARSLGATDGVMAGLAGPGGLNNAMLAVYRPARRLVAPLAWHGLGWLLGGVEIWLFLHVLGATSTLPAGTWGGLGGGLGGALWGGLAAGMVIESLSQAVKSAGFAVPGALGVQEGGFIAVCALFHIAPGTAIALSLVRRLREVTWSVPSLLVWQLLARRPHQPQPGVRDPRQTSVGSDRLG